MKQGELLAQIDDQVAKLVAEATKAKYDIARAKATNDVRLRYAQKATEVSQAELRRSTESIERFAKSVSQSQLDVEQLTVQKNRLEGEQATHEQQIATLEMKQQESELNAARRKSPDGESLLRSMASSCRSMPGRANGPNRGKRRCES